MVTIKRKWILNWCVWDFVFLRFLFVILKRANLFTRMIGIEYASFKYKGFIFPTMNINKCCKATVKFYSINQKRALKIISSECVFDGGDFLFCGLTHKRKHARTHTIIDTTFREQCYKQNMFISILVMCINVYIKAIKNMKLLCM